MLFTSVLLHIRISDRQNSVKSERARAGAEQSGAAFQPSISIFFRVFCPRRSIERFNTPARSGRARAIAVMEKLGTSFEVVHVHGNNHSPLISVGNVPFPEVLEVTFASKERYTFEDCHETFPTSIDKPNWSQTADLYLGQFKF
jgi:hypothetical protein